MRAIDRLAYSKEPRNAGLFLFLLKRLFGGVNGRLRFSDFAVERTPSSLHRPIVRIESSQKSAKGVHINDLAAYLDKQADAARKECEQLKRSA